jgi:transketolase
MIGTSGGLSDPLGPMVQSDSCLAALLSLRNLEVLEAGDINEAGYLLERALADDRPTYLRLPHESGPAQRSLEELRAAEGTHGVWSRRDPVGALATIVCAGSVTQAAVAAGDSLTADGIPTRVLQVYSHSEARRHFGFPGAETLTAAHHPTLVLHNAPGLVLGAIVGPGIRTTLTVEHYGEAGPSLDELLARGHLTADDAVSAIKALLAAVE